MKYGIYEEVINRLLDTQLLDEEFKIETETIGREESPKILAKYLSEIIEEVLITIRDKDQEQDKDIKKDNNISKQINICNKIIYNLASIEKNEYLKDRMMEKKGELLLTFLEKHNTIHAVNKKNEVVRPITSISQSSLFTGAPHEPNISSEFRREILSCNRIDILVSFIKFSGLRLIIDELREFTKKTISVL